MNSEDFGNFTCSCSDDWTGENCEVFIPCSSSPCLNNGTCDNFEDFSDFTCSCSNDHTGANCEIQIPCSLLPCQNNGTCVNSEDFFSHNCTCTETHTGENCEEQVTTTTLPPTTTNAQQREVFDLLIDEGVNNSDKNIAVTLIWNHNVDMDLHVFEPDGFQIWYEEPTSPSGGELDVDDQGVQQEWNEGSGEGSGEDTGEVHIENISWNSAPSGDFRIAVTNYDGSSIEVPYTVYLWIDGEITVFERIAPASDDGTYVVVSFSWSSSRFLRMPQNVEVGQVLIPGHERSHKKKSLMDSIIHELK